MKIMHHFYHPSGCCGTEEIEDILCRVPKKVNGKLENKIHAVGYGLQAVPGVALWKVLVALAFLHVGPLIFAVRWLLGHPGDLQNAFLSLFYLVGLLNLIVVLPDIWSFKK
jgi:hypothetical protein